MSTTALRRRVRLAAHGARARWRRHRVVAVARPDGGVLHWRRDERYPSAMLDGTYEPHLVARLTDLLHPGDHVLDVGANSGYLSLLAKALVGPAGRVVAVEPHPENLATLADRARLNPDLPIEVLAVAAAPAPGRATLELTRNLANGRLATAEWDHAKPSVSRIEVPARSFDDLVDEVRPTLVKVDIEGAEGEVLAASAGPEHWPTVPTLLVEYHGTRNRDRCLEAADQWGWQADDDPDPGGLPAGLLTLRAPSQERET